MSTDGKKKSFRRRYEYDVKNRIVTIQPVFDTSNSTSYKKVTELKHRDCQRYHGSPLFNIIIVLEFYGDVTFIKVFPVTTAI